MDDKGDGKRLGGSNEMEADVVLRWVEAPIGFQVEIDISAAGVVQALGVTYACQARWSEAFRLDRALSWVLDRLSRAGTAGELASDVLGTLPLGPVAEVERAILMEIAAVQALRVGVALKVGGAA